VAIVTNAAAGGLAAGACGDNGLQVAPLAGTTRRRLRRLLPAGAVVTGPVDTTAPVGRDAFRTCLEEVAADDGVDAVLAVVMPTALSDPSTAIAEASVSKPIAAVLLDQAESVRMLTPGRPCYGSPEDAARALGHAVRYRAWRDRPQGQVPELPGLRPADARKLLAAFLTRHPDGGWLPPRQAAELLAAYQIPLIASRATRGDQEAVLAADDVEVLIGVAQDPLFGPLVVFGPGGAAAGEPGDHAARLAPLTDTDADELIHATPLRSGHGHAPSADTGALADTLLRVSRLADDLPEVAELDLDPVIARADGVYVADVRVRVSPGEPRDPFLRQLR
jgi:acyl-CoA synthetase (NDP forming)